jgi:hypothetical protein
MYAFFMVFKSDADIQCPCMIFLFIETMHTCIHTYAQADTTVPMSHLKTIYNTYIHTYAHTRTQADTIVPMSPYEGNRQSILTPKSSPSGSEEWWDASTSMGMGSATPRYVCMYLHTYVCRYVCSVVVLVCLRGHEQRYSKVCMHVFTYACM